MINSAMLEKALNILDINQKPVDGDLKKFIKRKYHEKALELHPDKMGSKEGFQQLIAAYELILNAIESGHTSLIEVIKKRTPQNSVENKQKSNDFYLYKKAVLEYSIALEEYFERVRKVNLDPEDPEYIKLCERIRSIKQDLFAVVKMNPAGIWVGDCLEKIHRINVWLKNTNYSSR